MQEYVKDSRLLLLEDSETGDVAWLRRHGLDLKNSEYMRYMLDLEQRGASVPMTRQEIEQLFLGEDYTYNEQFDWYSGKSKFETGATGICYHPTEDLDDSFFKFHYEAPAVAHVLWRQIGDEIDIQSIAVDADFHFRQLMYEVLLDELKLFIMKACGYEHMEKIIATARSEVERIFYEKNHFRQSAVPQEGVHMYWIPEFEGREKENRWTEMKKQREAQDGTTE